MQGINQFTKDVVEKARSHMQMLVNRVFPDLECPCPPAAQRDSNKPTPPTNAEKKHVTSAYRSIAGRRLNDDKQEAYNHKQLPEVDGFVSRFNKPFGAALKLAQSVSKTGKIGKWKTEFVFDGDEPTLAEDLKDEQIIKSFIMQNGAEAKSMKQKAYLLPALKTSDNPEGFRLGKTILHQRATARGGGKTLHRGKDRPTRRVRF